MSLFGPQPGMGPAPRKALPTQRVLLRLLDGRSMYLRPMQAASMVAGGHGVVEGEMDAPTLAAYATALQARITAHEERTRP